MAKERQAWLDYVRFFSIFLVIVFHTPPRLPLIDDAVILNLRIPVFFCISGFLYSFDRWKCFSEYALHRARQILIPYTTFFIVFYILWIVVGRRIWAGSEAGIPVLQPLWEFFLGDPKIVTAPFWYISCLFTMQLIYYGVEWLVPRKWVFATCVAIAIATSGLLHLPLQGMWSMWWRPWNLGNALLFLPFYALGNSFKSRLNDLSFSISPIVPVAVLPALASVGLMIWVAPLKEVDYALYSLLRIPAGLLIIPAYFGVAKWLANRYGRCRVIEFVVMSGTVYLGMQNYFISVIKWLLERMLYVGVVDETLWLKPCIALTTMLLIYPVAWFIDRYIPWFIGKRKET